MASYPRPGVGVALDGLKLGVIIPAEEGLKQPNFILARSAAVIYASDDAGVPFCALMGMEHVIQGQVFDILAGSV
jgi:hypothetical protein